MSNKTVRHFMLLFAVQGLLLCGIAASHAAEQIGEQMGGRAAEQVGKQVGRPTIDTLRNPFAFTDFEYVRRFDPWLTGHNSSRIVSVLPVNAVSIVEAAGRKQHGGFANYYRAGDESQASFKTESFMRVNTRVGLYGAIEYLTRRENDLGGSAWIAPYSSPFDIVEAADTNRGRKQFEQHTLKAALSAAITRDLSAGMRVEYRAANYAKQKDLRHKNKLMDFSVSPSLAYSFKSVATLGADYSYRRTNESLIFGRYGNTDKDYYSIVSMGGLWGYKERMGEFGFTGSNTGNETRPMFNSYNGAGIQAEFRVLPCLNFFNEIRFTSREGYYGEKSQTKLQFTTHEADIFEYRGTVTFRRLRNTSTIAANTGSVNSQIHSSHTLTFKLNREALKNNINIYEKVQNPGEYSRYNYLGQRETLDRKHTLAEVSYRGDISVTHNYPQYVVEADFRYFNRNQRASLFPFYRKQNISSSDLNISATRNMFRERNGYHITLCGSLGNGSGKVNEDGLYAQPDEGQEPPARMELYMLREYEYLTSQRIGLRGSFRYSRSYLMPMPVRIYAEVGYAITKARGVEYLRGDKSQNISLKLGCSF